MSETHGSHVAKCERCKMLRDADRHHARQQDKYIEQLVGTIEALRRALDALRSP